MGKSGGHIYKEWHHLTFHSLDSIQHRTKETKEGLYPRHHGKY